MKMKQRTKKTEFFTGFKQSLTCILNVQNFESTNTSLSSYGEDNFHLCLKKKSNQNSCKTCLSFGVNRSSHTSLIIQKRHDKNHHLCPVRPAPFIYYSFHFCHNMLFTFLHIYQIELYVYVVRVLQLKGSNLYALRH